MSDHERLQILDGAGQVIGSMTRGEAEAANHVTANVLVFIFRSDGAVLVQLRPKNKKHFPGRWDVSACGGIVDGETPAESAKRELFEETGLTCPLQFVESFMNVFEGDNGETRRRLSYLYIGMSDETPRLSVEVDEFRYHMPGELLEEIFKNPGKFIPSFKVELEKAVAASTKFRTK